MNPLWLSSGLGLVFVVVLAAPFLNRKVETNLEIFLLAMGVVAMTISAAWSLALVEEALLEPMKITLAVLLAGIVFHFLRHRIRAGVHGVVRRLSLRTFVFSLVLLLGLVSSVISAIIAALVLVEVVSALDMPRRQVVRLVILACFAIGLGAVLTPLGEPLSTIATAKLQGEPYRADFFFLARTLWQFVVPGVIVLSMAAALLVGRRQRDRARTETADRPEELSHVAVRAGKVYLFVMALILLGGGFKPLIDLYVVHIPAQALYWVNSTSAILDNATLAAAEIGPSLSEL